MNTVGQTITEAFSYVSKVGEECEALAQLIRQEVSEHLPSAARALGLVPGKWSSRYKTIGAGWVYSDVVWFVPLAPVKQDVGTAHLSFQLSIFCDSPEAGSIDEPLLHISFWDSVTDPNTMEYMGFPCYEMIPSTMKQLANGCARLLRWPANTGQPDWWTYSLRVTGINTLEDVRSLITAPVTMLLADVDKGEELLQSLQKVVRYSPLINHEDHYRAE